MDAVRPLLLLLALAAAVGCGSAENPTAPGPARTTSVGAAVSLDPAAFAAAVTEQERVTVNVHVPYAGELAGTDLFLPYDRVETDAADLPADRSTPLAVYCLTGRMSAEAVADLRSLGYTDIVELAGGMRAWQQAGRPIQQ